MTEMNTNRPIGYDIYLHHRAKAAHHPVIWKAISTVVCRRHTCCRIDQRLVVTVDDGRHPGETLRRAWMDHRHLVDLSTVLWDLYSHPDELLEGMEIASFGATRLRR